MAPLWDDVKNAIVDGYVYASDKAEEVTAIGRAKVEILKLNRQIARAMGDMGGRVFEMFEKEEQGAIPEDSVLSESVKKIHGFREEISRWEKEIENARTERDSGAAGTTDEPQE
jgi:hypothetical protein